ncbi:MAG: type I-E CRISPR-associated protein Cse1/CasA [Geminicoccaceae bacterium]|nr:type I-E CRISPR-associated protein Cse1/CasA [Geminicoccaceae bacterium]
MSTLSLISSPWLPVRRRSGGREHVRPSELTSRIADDPIVALDWPRPDFDLACCELLIGLLALAGFREAADPEGWIAWWEEPPEPGDLARRLAPFEPAFLLDGPGPRFMQDFEQLSGEPEAIGKILIEAPGEQTLKRNIDHFVKRGGVRALGRAAAAMALFTLQNFAPGGGKGHRTSLRGGGPLVTLVLPEPVGGEPPLWHRLWLNAVWEQDWPEPVAAQMPRIFPWLGKTRTSEKNETTTPEDVHAAQAYFGMPRRIRLVFEENHDSRPCDLSGEVDAILVTGFRQRPKGANYAAWRHPLTPYYRQKPDSSEWLPVHPQPYRLGYRDWLGLVVSDQPGEGALRRPARVVEIARSRLGELDRRSARRARLVAAGYDMDNMKARGFVEAEMPLPLVPERVREAFEAVGRELVGQAREVASLLGGTLRQALFGTEAPGADAGDRYLAQERFWERTEAPFRSAIAELAEQFERAPDEEAQRTVLANVRENFANVLRRTALSIFDELVRFEAIEDQRTMERKIAARRRLVSGLSPRTTDASSKGRRREAA